MEDARLASVTASQVLKTPTWVEAGGKVATATRQLGQPAGKLSRVTQIRALARTSDAFEHGIKAKEALRLSITNAISFPLGRISNKREYSTLPSHSVRSGADATQGSSQHPDGSTRTLTAAGLTSSAFVLDLNTHTHTHTHTVG